MFLGIILHNYLHCEENAQHIQVLYVYLDNNITL